MIKAFYENHKKGCLLSAAITGSILFILYLYVLFLPGLWHWNAFLFKQGDDCFTGADEYASYEVTIERANNNATITFAVNDLVREYQITGTETGNDVYIYQDGKRVFHGHALSTGSSDYWLMGEEDSMENDILIFTSHQAPDPEELFPSKNWLYALAVSDKTDTFGRPAYLMIIFILIVYLVLDIKYPKLAFFWRYQHMVDGGEPSEWYYTSQMIGRVIIAIMIPVCMWMSLFYR